MKTNPVVVVSTRSLALAIMVSLVGVSTGAAVFDDFVKKLGESTLLYKVEKESKHFKRNLPNDNDWAYEFEIPLTLINPISLPNRLK